MPTIALLIPTKTSVAFELMQFIFLLSRSTPHPLMLVVDTSPQIDISRNKLVLTSLKCKADYVLFIDSDIIPYKCTENTNLTPAIDIIERWISIMENENVHGVTGLYWLKRNEPNIYIKHGETEICGLKIPRIKPAGVSPCAGILKGKFVAGLGLAMFKTELFRELNPPWFKFEFTMCNNLVHECGEDIYFFNKLVENNIDIAVDTNIIGFHEARGFLSWYGRLKLPTINLIGETL